MYAYAAGLYDSGPPPTTGISFKTDAAIADRNPVDGSFSFVECYSNNRADGTSSQCFNKLGYPNQYLTCNTFTNLCVPGPCSENSNCDVEYCCDKSTELPPALQKTGTCVLKGPPLGIIQPYLCTS